MEALSNPIISDFRPDEAEDHVIEMTEYLQNTQLHEDELGVNYSKIGGVYFLNGSIDFNELTLEVLPEPALTDGFISTSTGETLTIEAGSMVLTAQSLGTKIISGFYAIEEN